MDAVGVDGAVLVSPFSMYGYDASYALEVYKQHPGRFGLVKPVDPSDPAVAETIADWAATPGTIGIRIFLNRGGSTDPADPGINRVLASAAQQALPVNLMCTGQLELAAQLAGRHPSCRTNHFPTRTSGIHWGASSTLSVCTAACGALTGPAPSRC
jgi:hypothetical protein